MTQGVNGPKPGKTDIVNSMGDREVTERTKSTGQNGNSIWNTIENFDHKGKLVKSIKTVDYDGDGRIYEEYVTRYESDGSVTTNYTDYSGSKLYKYKDSYHNYKNGTYKFEDTRSDGTKDVCSVGPNGGIFIAYNKYGRVVVARVKNPETDEWTDLKYDNGVVPLEQHFSQKRNPQKRPPIK